MMRQFVYMCLVWPMVNAATGSQPQAEMRFREAPADDSAVGVRALPAILKNA
jgi:hypothetical protein